MHGYPVTPVNWIIIVAKVRGVWSQYKILAIAKAYITRCMADIFTRIGLTTAAAITTSSKAQCSNN